MSLVFSDTSTYKGIVQMYEKEIGVDDGFVSGNTTRLKKFTADANLALDDFIRIALNSSGKWQFDDSNQTDFPIISTNLVSGQRDYTFGTDESGNITLDVYKVFVADSSGIYKEMLPVDVNSGDYQPITSVSGQLYPNGVSGFTDGRNTTGIPNKYDKLGTSVLLDPIPSYNYTNGLKVYVNREGSYFTYTDTTKKPGVPGLFHKYFYLKPALDVARRNNLGNRQLIENEIAKMEGVPGVNGTIGEYFASRPRDEDKRLHTVEQNNH